MGLLQPVLGLLLFVLPILSSISTSSGHDGGSSDTIVDPSCSDGENWCKKYLIKSPKMFATTIDMDATPELVTTDKIMANKSTTQYLMYTYCDLMLNSKTVYSYTLDADRNPVKNGQFAIPFATTFPGLVFNGGFKMNFCVF